MASADQGILDEAKENFRIGSAAWEENYKRFDVCMRNLDGEQWEEKVISERGEDRPHIVINLLEQHVQQVVNINRQNRPGGKVSPVDGVADPDIAELESGLIRHTEYISNADQAYDTAVEYAAGGGIGFIGLTLDFIPGSFDQELRVRRFPDPKCVILDPNSQEPDGSDADWAIVRQKISKATYERKYGGKDDIADPDWVPTGDDTDWVDEDSVWLAEYWVRSYKTRNLVKLDDGASGYKDSPAIQAAVAAGAQITREREEKVGEVTQYLLSCERILSATAWAGTSIPIVPVYGQERYVDGKRKLKSLIADSLQAQKMVNYAESLNMEAMAMAPKPKFVMVEGQDEGYEDMWASANVSRDARLLYKNVSIGGQPAPAPEWRVFEPKSQAMDAMAARGQEYLKATTGQFDPSLGAQDPSARSGKAIQALQAQGANATSHFSDNLTRALKRLYRMMIEMFPKVLSPGQQQRIIGADDAQKVVRVDQVIDKQTGQPRSIDMSTGRYDVTVSVDSSRDSQREAANDVLAQIAQLPLIAQNPQIGPKFVALQIKQANLGPIGDQMVELLSPPPPQGQQPLPPEVQQQLAAGQQAQAAVQQLQHVIQTKQVEEQAKDQRVAMIEQARDQRKALAEQSADQRAGWLKDKDIRLALIAQKTALLINEQKLNAAQDLQDTRNQLAYIDKVLDQGHEVAVKAADANHEARMTQMQHEHSLESQQQQADLQPDPQPQEQE